MKKILVATLLLLGICKFSYAGSISVSDFITGDDVTITHLQDFKNTVVNAINSADGGLLQAATVTTAKLDANANPENRWDELTTDFVYTGLLPPSTTGTLLTTTTAGTAYINGVRVLKDATAHTYTASRHTFVDLSDAGTYTYSAITHGGTEPSTALSSIRLARVSSDATQILSVRDDRTTTVSIAAGSGTSVWDTDADTGWQTQETADEDILRGDTGGSQRIQIDSDGVTLESGASVNEFSTDGTLAGDSDDASPTEKAVKTYADALTGLAQAYSGSFTREMVTATGTQAVTGVGFTPRALTLFAASDVATGKMSIGLAASSGPDGVVSDYTTVSDNQWAVTTGAIAAYQNAGNNYTGAIDSYDADGFTISWERTGTPTGTLTIKFLAIR